MSTTDMKMPKHITRDTFWPAPHKEIMRLASNLEDRVHEEVLPAVALLKSAHKYRYELAELERRDSLDAGKGNGGAWCSEIETHESEKYRIPGDDPFDPDEMVRNFAEVLDGCCVLVRAAQGKALGTEIKPWMFQGTTRTQHMRIALREGQREIERAFLECISNMAAYISDFCLEMAVDPDSKDPQEQDELRKHNGMTLSEHLSQLCHRLEKLSVFHDQCDNLCVFAESYEEYESYDDWLSQVLLGKIRGNQLRTSLAAVMKEQRKACEDLQKSMDEIEEKYDAVGDLGNVIKLRS